MMTDEEVLEALEWRRCSWELEGHITVVHDGELKATCLACGVVRYVCKTHWQRDLEAAALNEALCTEQVKYFCYACHTMADSLEEILLVEEEG